MKKMKYMKNLFQGSKSSFMPRDRGVDTTAEIQLYGGGN